MEKIVKKFKFNSGINFKKAIKTKTTFHKQFEIFRSFFGNWKWNLSEGKSRRWHGIICIPFEYFLSGSVNHDGSPPNGPATRVRSSTGRTDCRFGRSRVNIKQQFASTNIWRAEENEKKSPEISLRSKPTQKTKFKVWNGLSNGFCFIQNERLVVKFHENFVQWNDSSFNNFCSLNELFD